jgi:hypothetical protein
MSSPPESLLSIQSKLAFLPLKHTDLLRDSFRLFCGTGDLALGHTNAILLSLAISK